VKKEIFFQHMPTKSYGTVDIDSIFEDMLRVQIERETGKEIASLHVREFSMCQDPKGRWVLAPSYTVRYKEEG